MRVMRSVSPGRPRRVSPAAYDGAVISSRGMLSRHQSVAKSVAGLTVMRDVHASMARGLAGAMMSIAEMELKIEGGHFIFYFASAAFDVQERLVELGQAAGEGDEPVCFGLAGAVVEACADNGHAAISSALAAAEAIGGAQAAYLATSDPLLDMPSRRLIARVDLDMQAIREWCRRAWARLERGRPLRPPAAVERALAALIAGNRSSLKSIARPARAQQAARDPRLATFHHTRRYDGADILHLLPRAGAYRNELVEMARVQRDEMDAIETFCNVLYDLKTLRLDMMRDLARLIWDEARHAEAGQALLRHAGLPPFAVPCGIVGINVRSPLPPLIAFAQIHAFGEAPQLKALRRFVRRARDAGDALAADAFEFVLADERGHVRIGRRCLADLCRGEGRSWTETEEEARRLAVQRLHEEGVLEEDYVQELDAAALARLLGE